MKEIKWEEIPSYAGEILTIVNTEGVQRKITYNNRMGQLTLIQHPSRPTVFLMYDKSSYQEGIKIFVNLN
jgi:hypothetical protein